MPVISESWDKRLGSQYQLPFMNKVQDRLSTDIKSGLTICPKVSDIFNTYKLVSYEDVQVVIVGQDPYYSKNTANGLAFSSNTGITPSLEVIFKEIKDDTGRLRTEPKLDDWAAQGVFLINTVLTTVQGQALAHSNIGWEQFTNQTLRLLNIVKRPLVVMLWGTHAIQFERFFDGNRHLILKAPHPQSDNYGNSFRTFSGCRHFSKCNEFRQKHRLKQINWGNHINI